MTHQHEWSCTGLYVAPRVIAVPCVESTCPAAMLQAVEVEERRFPLAVCGVPLDLHDVDGPGAIVKIACYEATHEYRLDTIPLAPGALVLDIGAHVGTVSCYFAKARPDVRVMAVEPAHRLYRLLQQNLAANAGDEHAVITINCGVGLSDRVTLRGDFDLNSGGVTAYATDGPVVEEAGCVSLRWLLDEYGADRVDLLKIDCEGAEHEVLTDDVLDRVDFLVGEFHHAPQRGHDAHALLARVRERLGAERVRVTVVNV